MRREALKNWWFSPGCLPSEVSDQDDGGVKSKYDKSQLDSFTDV